MAKDGKSIPHFIIYDEMTKQQPTAVACFISYIEQHYDGKLNWKMKNIFFFRSCIKDKAINRRRVRRNSIFVLYFNHLTWLLEPFLIGNDADGENRWQSNFNVNLELPRRHHRASARRQTLDVWIGRKLNWAPLRLRSIIIIFIGAFFVVVDNCLRNLLISIVEHVVCLATSMRSVGASAFPPEITFWLEWNY